ncbi:hypothetical protein CRUP_028399 [Coryphaenoides rupestris]|nr:hypothetical protein CRUP_028399 [Coryphaenoides rupestris]
MRKFPLETAAGEAFNYKACLHLFAESLADAHERRGWLMLCLPTHHHHHHHHHHHQHPPAPNTRPLPVQLLELSPDRLLSTVLPPPAPPALRQRYANKFALKRLRPSRPTTLHTDLDKGESEVKYTLSGDGAGSIFTIDQTTGDIHALRSLDREEKPYYTLRAQAVDMDTDRPLEPESEFVIKVQDINDNEPKFLEGPYTATVPEMSPVGTYVTQVTATDADDPTYGNSARVVYSILHGQPYFSVDPKTGVMQQHGVCSAPHRHGADLQRSLPAGSAHVRPSMCLPNDTRETFSP